MKLVIVLLTMMFSFSVQASGLAELKKTPASKYEVGKLQLEFWAYIATEKTAGQKFGDSGFLVARYRAEERQEKLAFVVVLEGKAKDMNDSACNMIKAGFLTQEPNKNLHRHIWPGLSEQQYSQLANELIFAVELVSKENAAFKIQC